MAGLIGVCAHPFKSQKFFNPLWQTPSGGVKPKLIILRVAKLRCNHVEDEEKGFVNVCIGSANLS
jgi:hypothetical protein